MREEKTIQEIMAEMHKECEGDIGEPCLDNCLDCVPEEVFDRWLGGDIYQDRLTQAMKLLDDWEQHELIRKQETL